MTDIFFPSSLRDLLMMILHQYDAYHTIFGIPESLFFRPRPDEPIATERFGQLLENPVGVAAGPHTQLTQNIVAAWLTGARFIELKTIQTLDELEIVRPCIDMQDEGYNCEWSQELKIKESFTQYLNAWIIIHILKDNLKIGRPDVSGFIFNMSVGYNLDGILMDNVQWFLRKMTDASAELNKAIESIRDIYPKVGKLNIKPEISDNITLSTMHGCPPDEIEKIGEYLLKEKKLHTTIKFNPTLLGRDDLFEILNNSGFETKTPDIAFEHDLIFEDAKGIIKRLGEIAKKNNLIFGLKLTNTLESRNHKNVFPAETEMMYMSGRALHPVAVNVARRLQNDFQGALDISFSGGADAFNITELVACGLYPVTVCTDLLKPGGYSRLAQYIDKLRQNSFNYQNDTLKKLNDYADFVKCDPAYRRTYINKLNIKTNKPLHYFDCIAAPCMEACPTHQEIPDYMFYAGCNDLTSAAKTVIKTNPFPVTTGMICDHLCQSKCTRINYDQSLQIREVKRVIAENAPTDAWYSSNCKCDGKIDVAIVGAGPSGLSCAWFLSKAGFNTVIFESKDAPGGMVSGAVPSFRLTGEAFNRDVERIEEAGVKIHFNHPINRTAFENLCKSYDFVYVAAGAQKSRPLEIEGIDADGVYDPLELLFDVKDGDRPYPGKDILIIGGGNTAMDAARTAVRLAGKDGKVTVVYRRTIKEMPADIGEIKACMDEGVEFVLLAAPVRILTINNQVSGLLCRRMKQGEPDETGRRKSIEIPDSDFTIAADAIIPAIGQERDFDFVKDFPRIAGQINYQTGRERVFIGGDALRGASTAINAIADGRKAATQIIAAAGQKSNTKMQTAPRIKKSMDWHLLKRAKREFPLTSPQNHANEIFNFDLLQKPLTLEEGIREAQRCLLCDDFCSICTSVCPNLALFTYQVVPGKRKVKKLILTNERTEVLEEIEAGVSQEYQILHIPDWCNQCGNCTTFCPTAGAPYKDKPHLHLTRKSFETDDTGFFYDGESLHLRKDGRTYSFKNHSTGYFFENNDFSLELNDEFEIQKHTLKSEKPAEVDLSLAVEMYLVLQGALRLKINNQNN
jgi:putative selenate reductase